MFRTTWRWINDDIIFFWGELSLRYCLIRQWFSNWGPWNGSGGPDFVAFYEIYTFIIAFTQSNIIKMRPCNKRIDVLGLHSWICFWFNYIFKFKIIGFYLGRHESDAIYTKGLENNRRLRFPQMLTEHIFSSDDPELWDFTLNGIDVLEDPAGSSSEPFRPSTPSLHKMATRSKTPQRAQYLRPPAQPQGHVVPHGQGGYGQVRSDARTTSGRI